MSRRRRSAAAGVVLAAALCAGTLAPVETDAAWVDAEVGTSSSLAAGVVAPAAGLRCTGSGLLQPVTYTWNAPTAGLPVAGYRWTLTGGLTGNGTLGASATSVTLFSSGLLVLGSGTFSLYAVGPGGWESTRVTGTVTVLSLLLGVTSSCSVP